MSTNNVLPNFDVPRSHSSASISLTREDPAKRGRGFSANAKTFADLHHQRSLRVLSPDPQLGTDYVNAPLPSNKNRSGDVLPIATDLRQDETVSLESNLLRTEATASTAAQLTPKETCRDVISDAADHALNNGPLGLQEDAKIPHLINPRTGRATDVSQHQQTDSLATPDRGTVDRINHAIAQGNVQRTATFKDGITSKSPLTLQQHGDLQSRISTVGRFALEHLWAEYEIQAKDKIDYCISVTSSQPEPVELVCAPNADTKFDQLLVGLACVVRREPKQLIDRLMRWRRENDESAAAFGSTPLARTVAHSPQISNGYNSTGFESRVHAPVLPHETVSISRRSSVATYITCRVLIEVYRQTDIASLTPGLAIQMADLVYSGQIRKKTRDDVEKTPLSSAKWHLVTQLFGLMAELDFESASSMFLNDLKEFHKVLGVKGYTRKDVENQAILVMKSMKYLQLKAGSEIEWARSCDFMNGIADLFSAVHGQAPKIAYCRLVGVMLLPLAGTNITDYDRSAWKRVLYTLNEKISQLLLKPKYWQNAFPVQFILACVSPYDVFMSKWQQLTNTLSSKLRERNNRATVLKATSRMLWTYLHNTGDAQSTIIKTLEDVTRIVFFSGKKYSLSTEPAIVEPLIQLIRIVGFKNQDFCFRTIIFPLISYDILASGRDIKINQLDPDRTVIGIRAFLAIFGDIERRQQPPFPVDFADERLEDSNKSPKSPTLGFKHDLTSRSTSVTKVERLSKPVITDDFPEVTKDYHKKFCAVLGKIITLCGNAFGSLAVLDDKLSSATPKTPIAENWSFNRREESFSSGDDRHSFYDLLHVAILALPRCLSDDSPLPSVLNLLCTGTSHVETNIAMSSIKSLKSIAREGHAQLVVARFSAFILSYDARYSTDGGLLSTHHIEGTLKLYVELLQLWIGELQNKSSTSVLTEQDSSPTVRIAKLDGSARWSQVDRVESQGLLFLSSPLYLVRMYAVEVLRLVVDLDKTLGQTNARIISKLQGSAQTMMNLDHISLTVAERTVLEKGLRKHKTESVWIQLCTSSEEPERSLWNKVFPYLIRAIFEVCPVAVTQTREDICIRLSQLDPLLDQLDERPRSTQASAYEHSKRETSNSVSTFVDVTIEQWKLYLIFACSTLTKTGSSQQVGKEEPNHTRKNSRSSQCTQDSFTTAIDLFGKVVPRLFSEHPSIRHAAAVGLGSININLYKTLLEFLSSSAQSIPDHSRKLVSHQRAASSPRRHEYDQRLRTGLSHVYKLTSHFLRQQEAYQDVWILDHIAAYVSDLQLFLQAAENESQSQRLRVHYCGLVEGFFLGINETNEPGRWMSFQTRRASFTLMENWCGCSPGANNISRQHLFDSNYQDAIRAYGQSTIAAQHMETKDLRDAALSAMATLCAGPISIRSKGGNLQFDIKRMLVWIDNLFSTDSDRTHNTGRRALKNLIWHNSHHDLLLDRLVEQLYVVKSSKALDSYVHVLCDVLNGEHAPEIPFWKTLSALLFILGNPKSDIRMKAARLLRHLDERQLQGSKLQDLDTSISDQTTAVNKQAQFDISVRLAEHHSQLAFLVFSEFTKRFMHLTPDNQRNMVSAMLPWIKIIELQLDPTGGPNADSYMVLVNLLHITMGCGSGLHHEVTALWETLVAGPYAGNVKLILDFIIDLSLDRRDESYVTVAKQIVVFISSKPAGTKVMDFLLQKLEPKLGPEDGRRKTVTTPTGIEMLPFVADISVILPSGGGQGIPIAQLCLVLLVDLVVSKVQLADDAIPRILHVVLISWDSNILVVKEQSRVMLIHLIHELVISKLEEAAAVALVDPIEELIELIRCKDVKINWTWEESGWHGNDTAIPDAMKFVVKEVVRFFGTAHPGVKTSWCRLTIQWATQCNILHVACRSAQLYQCIHKAMDKTTILAMFYRLATTIGDEEETLQHYSTEILRTIKGIIEIFDDANLPEVFWLTCAALDSPNELEFAEALSMLEVLLDRCDLGDKDIVQRLMDRKPADFTWTNGGLTTLVYKGCKSDLCLDRSLNVLLRLLHPSISDLFRDQHYLMRTTLAYVPRLAQLFTKSTTSTDFILVARRIATAAHSLGQSAVCSVLDNYTESHYRASNDFVSDTVAAIARSFSPGSDSDVQCLQFLLGLLTNKFTWYKLQVLQMISTVVPLIDAQETRITSQGPDLVSPLLRLLHTELCPQALKALDSLIGISITSTEQYYLSMSMVGSRSSRTLQKEFENKESLYGIPKESGWSIPMPAKRKVSTRINVMAVSEKFGEETSQSSFAATTPEIEFCNDDYGRDSYFKHRTNTMISNDATLAETNMGELVSTLDGLDDFFDSLDGTVAKHSIIMDESRNITPPYTYSGAQEPYSCSMQANYPKQMLNQGVSFTRVGHHQMQPTPTRKSAVMSPSAFSASPKSPGRPGIGSRSVTSPAISQRTAPTISLGGTTDDTEPFSDDDLSLGRTSTSDHSFADNSLASMRARSRFRSSVRSGFKRLTTAHRSLSRQRAFEDSPEVPKVPEVYLQNPRSSEL